ncbi:MAG: ABC transporter permease [Pseudomonadota bacterium]
MQEISDGLAEAATLVLSGDPALVEIILLSLQVSGSAVVIACLLGLPLGALLAVARFPGRGAVIVTCNALMGLPPVVVGLTLYLLLSRAGPLGPLGLLYTPEAMVLAQAVLVTPIVAALSRQVLSGMAEEYDETLRAMGASKLAIALTLLRDARFALITVALAGFGRAIAEVGAVLIVGGNINHATRVMTTAIALETSRGNLALALGLGLVLILLALSVNAAVMALGQREAAHA